MQKTVCMSPISKQLKFKHSSAHKLINWNHRSLRELTWCPTGLLTKISGPTICKVKEYWDHNSEI